MNSQERYDQLVKETIALNKALAVSEKIIADLHMMLAYSEQSAKHWYDQCHPAEVRR